MPIRQEAGPLPAPTTDLDEAKRDLRAWGYCLLADALTGDEIAALLDRLDEQAAGERATGHALMDGGLGEDRFRGPNQRVFHLLNKGVVFRGIPLHERVNELVGEILGPKFLLSSFTANIAAGGGHAQDLHQDQWYLEHAWHGRPEYAVVANVAWFLDDVDAGNGGTLLVPASHAHPDPNTLIEGAEPIAGAGPAGTALVFDGRLLHGTGPNTSGRLRRVLLTYYCQPFMRQQENPFLALADDVVDELPEELCRMLGFEAWYSLGHVYDQRPLPRDLLYHRPHPPMGELQADGAAKRLGASIA